MFRWAVVLGALAALSSVVVAQALDAPPQFLGTGLPQFQQAAPSVSPLATPPNLPIEIDGNCILNGSPTWTLHLRYPAGISPVTIRFLELGTGRFLAERTLATPAVYSGLDFGPISGLEAERIVNGKPLDANRHRGQDEVPCKAPPPPPPSSTMTSTSTTSTTVVTTTTSAPPSTTVPGIFVSAIGTTCRRDVPVITILMGNRADLDGRPATIRFFDVRGSLIETHVVPYRAGGRVTLLYPGAKVDPVTGEATDWPGWKLNADGFWVEDPSDAGLRLGLRVTIDVNPHAESSVSYPPANTACNSPSGPFPPESGVPPTTGGIPPAR